MSLLGDAGGGVWTNGKPGGMSIDIDHILGVDNHGFAKILGFLRKASVQPRLPSHTTIFLGAITLSREKRSASGEGW